MHNRVPLQLVRQIDHPRAPSANAARPRGTLGTLRSPAAASPDATGFQQPSTSTQEVHAHKPDAVADLNTRAPLEVRVFNLR